MKTLLTRGVLLQSLLLLWWGRNGCCFVPLLQRQPLIRSIDPIIASTAHNARDDEDPLVVAIVGGGWAGFSAANAIVSSSKKDIQVVLLDASPRGPGGLAGSGWTTPKLGLPVEAGIHGFWREYKNTFAQMEGIGLNLNDVLTPYQPSLLASSQGRVAIAPVLGQDNDATLNNGNSDKLMADPLLKQIAELLPPPLDIALLAEYDQNSKLTVADRLSALGLLGVWADFGQEDDASWKRYDKISADQLFRSIAGISPTLYAQLVEPLLHVLPMTTGYDCSAAAALSCFHVFALQSHGAFDVRWCRGSIAQQIFDPWVKYLTERNVNIRGSCRVTCMERAPNQKVLLTVNDNETLECDAVVMAVGATAAKRLITCSPVLQAIPGLADTWQGLRGVTCVAVRLILDGKQLSTRFQRALSQIPPVIVCGPGMGKLPTLVETGCCVYDLSRLQDAFSPETLGRDLLVLEVDFFRADTIANLADDNDVVAIALQSVEAAILDWRIGSPTTLNADMVQDYGVVRARNAVSHFCIGSAASSPSSVRLADRLYICGDWIDRTGHASWSTEKAVVTGRQAAETLLQDLNVEHSSIDVIPAASDTVPLQALRQMASLWRRTQFDRPGLFPRLP